MRLSFTSFARLRAGDTISLRSSVWFVGSSAPSHTRMGLPGGVYMGGFVRCSTESHWRFRDTLSHTIGAGAAHRDGLAHLSYPKVFIFSHGVTVTAGVSLGEDT